MYVDAVFGTVTTVPEEREQAIRERSYAIWEQEGCPDGKDVSHWLLAEAEMSSADPKRSFRGCGHRYDVAQDSRAHIIPSALGGKLKPRGLLCRCCNGLLDELADNPLIKSLGFFTTFFGIERDRGDNPSLLWTAPDGIEYWLSEDGRLSYRRAVVAEKQIGDATQLSISSPNRRALEHKLRELRQKYPQIDPVDALQHTTENSYRISDYLRHGLQLGPGTTFPGILAMLWMFHLHKTGRAFYPWERLLVELRTPVTLDMFFYILAPESWLIGPELEIPHRLALKSDERGILFGYVDLFGVIRVGGVIARNYPFQIEHVYVYDLLGKRDRSAEFSIANTFRVVDLERPGLAYALDREADAVMAEVTGRISRIMPIGLKRNFEREKDRIVEAFLDKLAATGANRAAHEAAIGQFAQEIAALVIHMRS